MLDFLFGFFLILSIFFGGLLCLYGLVYKTQFEYSEWVAERILSACWLFAGSITITLIVNSFR